MLTYKNTVYTSTREKNLVKPYLTYTCPHQKSIKHYTSKERHADVLYIN